MTTYCTKHGCSLECLGGRSAHESNWYCPKCDYEKLTGRTQVAPCTAPEIDELVQLRAENEGLRDLLKRTKPYIKSQAQNYHVALLLLGDIKQALADSSK